jgi:AraC-like DNA-binding protein
MKPRYTPILTEDASLLKVVLQQSEKEFAYPWHYHPEYELIYIVTSRGMRYVGDSIEKFEDNDLVLVGSNLPHCWISSDDQTNSTSSAIVVHLKKEFIESEWMDTTEFSTIKKLFEMSKKGIKFNKRVALKLKEHFLRLLSAAPFEKMMLLFQILNELSNPGNLCLLSDHDFPYNLHRSNSDRINIVYKYIQKHYSHQITLAEMAAQVHMTEEYFSRYFSKVMKKTFFEFLNEYKINRACKLLIETDKRVGEICYDSGFESIPFFYRQFKRFKNCQPKAFRLNYRKASS